MFTIPKKTHQKHGEIIPTKNKFYFYEMNFNSEEILAKTITNKFSKTEINSLPFIVQEVKICFS